MRARLKVDIVEAIGKIGRNRRYSTNIPWSFSTHYDSKLYTGNMYR